MASRNQFGKFKSKIIHFRKRNIKEVHLHCVGNTSLEYVAAYNYLGVLFKKKKKEISKVMPKMYPDQEG